MRNIVFVFYILVSFSSFSSEIERSIFEIKIGKFVGSGVFLNYKKKKFLLTNYHVCMMDIGFSQRDTQYIELKNYYSNIGMSFERTIKSFVIDEYNDICLIPVDNMFDYLKIRYLKIRINEIDKNKKMVLLTPGLNKQIYSGIKILGVDSKEKNFAFPKDHGHIIDFPIEHGMSGSPLLDENNRIAMLVWGSMTDNDSKKGLAIDNKSVLKLLNSDLK